jgi:AGCS family alanine or glycine:cation symporter
MKQIKRFWMAIALLLALPGTPLAAQTASPGGLLDVIDAVFAAIFTALEKLIFFTIGGMPFVVLWLLVGAIFFTLRMKFVNIRAFRHSLDVLRGQYDDPDEPGEVSYFQALSAALSATVGLGNIAGVAIAIQLGGSGAVFWMTVVGFLGMSSKFAECTLARMYRIVRPDGTISGGSMHYHLAGFSREGTASPWQSFG